MISSGPLILWGIWGITHFRANCVPPCRWQSRSTCTAIWTWWLASGKCFLSTSVDWATAPRACKSYLMSGFGELSRVRGPSGGRLAGAWGAACGECAEGCCRLSLGLQWGWVKSARQMRSASGPAPIPDPDQEASHPRASWAKRQGDGESSGTQLGLGPGCPLYRACDMGPGMWPCWTSVLALVLFCLSMSRSEGPVPQWMCVRFEDSPWNPKEVCLCYYERQGTAGNQVGSLSCVAQV